MSQTHEQDEDSAPSRRKFLKVSVLAGATVATLATGASLLPGVNAVAASRLQSELSPSTTQVGTPMIVVIKNGTLDIYQGENAFQIADSSLASQLSGQLLSRVGE